MVFDKSEQWLLKYCKPEHPDELGKQQRMYYTETGSAIMKQVNSVLKNTPEKAKVVETLFPNLTDLDKFKTVVYGSIIETHSEKRAMIQLLTSVVKQFENE